MGKHTSEHQDRENKHGAQDASKGSRRREPWAKPFESFEHYDERRDAYNAGYDNTSKQKYESGGGGCFPSTALVLTTDGWKQIVSVNPGDLVLSYNSDKQQIEPSTVLLRKNHKPERLWKLDFEDGGDQLITTGSHSFLTERGWLKTKKLKVTDKLISTNLFDEKYRVLRSIRETQESAPVYNLITAGSHTFIVNGIVAHNFTVFRSLRTWIYSILIDYILQRQSKLTKMLVNRFVVPVDVQLNI
jgi:hypothetical protein